MSVPKVLCAGLTTVDHLWRVEEFPPRGSRTPTTDHETSGGGPAATAAVAAARLGAQVKLLTVVGADPAGEGALVDLAARGVDVSESRRLRRGRTAVSGVIVTPDGERYIFPFFGDALDDEAVLGLDMGVVERSGAVLVDLRLPRLTANVLSAADRAGVPSVADASSAHYWERADAVGHLIASQECATEVLGRDDPVAALQALRRRDGQVVGVTLGDRGVIIDTGETTRLLPAFPVQAVDTTGAGDVFHGAYAYGLARGWDALRCAELASAAAALACTGLGREAIPDLEAVCALMASNGRPARL